MYRVVYTKQKHALPLSRHSRDPCQKAG